MRKLLALLVLPLLLAVAACDMPPPEDGTTLPADPAATTEPATTTTPAQ